jgi:predicted Zn finger-like uncharacterized protein
MIIECVKCNKKFEVNSELIPSEGRTIQCGSCSHIWFFVKTDSAITNFSTNENDEKNDFFSEIDNTEIKSQNVKTKSFTKQKINTKKKSNLTFGKFLSYILVLIISFIAAIVVIDTFSAIIYSYFPNLELIMYNFFEILKDIKLFIKDLI